MISISYRPKDFKIPKKAKVFKKLSDKSIDDRSFMSKLKMKTDFKEVRDQIRNQVSSQVMDQVRWQVMDQVRWQVRNQVYDQVRIQIFYQVYDQVREDLYEN